MKAFQQQNNIQPTGILTPRTRSALNGGVRVPRRGRPRPRARRRSASIVNMERWRWMPEHLGELHIQDNLPEFMARVFKKGQMIHSAKIIIGKVETPTAVFSANMRTVVFHPEWGVPDSIKVKELAPYLSGGGGGFFFFWRRRHLDPRPPADARGLQRPDGERLIGGLGPGRHPPLHVHPVGGAAQRAGRRQVPVPQQARHLHARHTAARAVRAAAGACSATAACACRIPGGWPS